MLLSTGCTKKNERVKIQFASWGSKSEVEIIKDVIKDFETSHPDIEVEFLHIPQNYFQKIHLLFASNTEPDVLFLNNLYLPVYANAGKLLELSAPQGIYDKKVLEALSWHGSLYAVPRDISLLIVYYNKDLFRKSGVAEPQNGWTREEFLAKALKIKEKTGMFRIFPAILPRTPRSPWCWTLRSAPSARAFPDMRIRPIKLHVPHIIAGFR